MSDGPAGPGTAVLANALAECEAIIERGLDTFVEVGGALLRIRGDRLYRESHGTFESYCRERWGFNRNRANQLISAAEMTTVVVSEGLPAPRNEAVARELGPLKTQPEELQAVWADAIERHGETPTAREVREVVKEREHESSVAPAVNGRQAINAHASQRAVERLAGTCRGLQALAEIRANEVFLVADDAEVRGYIRSIREGEKALRALRQRLEQGRKDQ